MRVEKTQLTSPYTSKKYPAFGIFKGYKKTTYGDYTWGEYKGYKIEIYNANKLNQKLQYVSDKTTLKWIWSKLKYIQNGINKVITSKAPIQ